MTILPNVIFDVQRSFFTANAGSSEPQPYLFRQEGHIQPAAARHLSVAQTSGVKIGYSLRVDAGLDIRVGDIISNIYLKDTGVLWQDNDGGIQTWRVIDAVDSTPGILSYRLLILTRFIAGGPAPL